MAEVVSTVAPYAFREPLALCLDLKNPLAYLAVQPAFALADDLGLTLECLPFPAAALKAPAPMRDDEDRGTRHRRLRAEYVARDIARYAGVQKLVVRSFYRSPDTSAFDAGLLWLNQRSRKDVRAYLRQAFRGYWQERLDVEDPLAIARVIEGLGQDEQAFARFAANEAPALAADLRERLVAAGVFNVPSFVVEGQVFVGRAHLPLVRWLLEGRRGPPPV